jgi:hypothetical protein
MTSIQDMPPAPPASAAVVDPVKPAVQEKKAPSSSRIKKAAVKEAQPQPAPKQWTYKPQTQPAPQPQQKQAQQKGGISGFLDRALGPEKPVTPPPQTGDAKYGM